MIEYYQVEYLKPKGFLFSRRGVRLTHKPSNVSITINKYWSRYKNHAEATKRLSNILDSQLKLTEEDERFIFDNAIPCAPDLIRIQFFERNDLYHKMKDHFNSLFENRDVLDGNYLRKLSSFTIGDMNCFILDSYGDDEFTIVPLNVGDNKFKNFDIVENYSHNSPRLKLLLVQKRNDFKPSKDVTKVNTAAGDVKRQVVCAANKYPCGTIVLGVRHFCPLMRQNIKALGIKPTQTDMVQGFVDQWGNFMDRSEALEVVKANGRFMRDTDFHHRELFSENCY